MHAYLHCLSHSPLVGYVDPAQEVLDEVNGVIASARERIAAFSPELVVLFAPDHYNGFFYDVMPPFCLGVGATAIGDFGSAAGELPVPVELAEACAHAVMKSGIDLAVSYCMQVDHGFAQPLEFLLGGLDKVPVLPVFINGVATPLPGFQRTRMLGEAIGRFTSTLNKRVLFLGSGGLSHQPPVPELAKADAHMRDRLLGSGKDLPASERELRQQRVISAAEKFVEDQRTLHPLNPIWDNQFMTLLEQGRIPVGIAMGLSPTVRGILDPVIELYRPVPPLAYLPLMVIWFGIGETSKILLIYLAIFAPVAMSALAGVKSAQQVRIRAAQSLGASRAQVLWFVILPGALPEILTGLRIGLGVGWSTLVAAELIAATRGLGFMVQSAGEFLATDVVLAGIAVIAIIAFLLELGLRALQRRLTPWHGEVQ
ncbi:3-carboxyethylcatechol 2,3-dioxygenase [Escherichia coli]|nr:3-carboxyethylcatechol 2,3-dioxygenase [Escherichia coli]